MARDFRQTWILFFFFCLINESKNHPVLLLFSINKHLGMKIIIKIFILTFNINLYRTEIKLEIKSKKKNTMTFGNCYICFYFLINILSNAFTVYRGSRSSITILHTLSLCWMESLIRGNTFLIISANNLIWLCNTQSQQL